jgi:parallel beta-helix repeat protein
MIMRPFIFVFVVLSFFSTLWAQRLQPFGLDGQTVTALAVSPADPSTTWNKFMFAATENSGVFYRYYLFSPDHGWFDWGLTGEKTACLFFYHWGAGPADFNTLFAGMVTDGTGTDSTLIYRYDDQSWWVPSDSGIDHSQVFGIRTIDGLFFSGHEPPQPLFAGGGNSIYRSSHLGESWEKIWSAPGPVNVLKVHQGQAQVWAGGSWGRDDPYPWIAASFDRGVTWERSDINAGGINSVMSIAVDPDNPKTVYAGLVHAVMKSTDSGKSWTFTGLVNVPACIAGLAIDSGDPKHIWAGGSVDEGYSVLKADPFKLWESFDGGSSWKQIKADPKSGLAGVVSLVSDTQQPDVVYIATKGSGVWRYSSRSKPHATIRVWQDYYTIQDAIDAAVSGDTVLVEPGEYVENIDFKGRGILLVSAQGVEKTIIDGAENGSVITFTSGEDSTATVKGFTINYGAGSPAEDGRYYGGGIYCSSSSPRILCNLVRENFVETGCGSCGGGMAILGNSCPLVEGNRFIANGVSSLCDALVNYGGAIYVAGSSAPLLRENIFHYNYADWGGGIAVQDSARPVIQKNRFYGNLWNSIWIGQRAVPLIGGSSGTGNDISPAFMNMQGGALLRSGDGPLINAQYNYFGACPPGENQVYPLQQFDTRNCSTWPVQDHFPLVIGNRWTFGITTSVSPAIIDTVRETVIDTVSIYRRPYFRFDQFRGLEHPLLKLTEENKLIWRLDPAGSEEKVWVDFTAQVGDRWDVSNGLENWTVELQSKTDHIEVPAGTFNNCYRFHFYFDGMDNDWDEWYAPGIGPVKRILNGAVAQWEYLLVSAHVRGIDYTAVRNSYDALPEKQTLYQNYPNPFNAATCICYDLHIADMVTLDIYNVAGQHVRSLVALRQSRGSHSIQWDGTDDAGKAIPSGVYIYRLHTNGWSINRRMVLLR